MPGLTWSVLFIFIILNITIVLSALGDISIPTSKPYISHYEPVTHMDINNHPEKDVVNLYFRTFQTDHSYNLSRVSVFHQDAMITIHHADGRVTKRKPRSVFFLSRSIYLYVILFYILM